MAKKRRSQISDSEQSENEVPKKITRHETISDGSDSENAPKSSKSLTKSPKTDSQSPNTSFSMRKSEFEALSPTEKFLALNPDLNKAKCGLKLSKNDDISILQIPRSINPTELLEKSINFDKKTKLKINGVKYVIRPDSQEEIEPILVLGKKLRLIHPISHLRIKKHIKNKQIDELETQEEVKISLPNNLKERHPLFGADYKKKIVLDEDVERKLNETIESVVKNVTKPKKKKHKVEETPVEIESFANLFEDTSNKKSKKSKKLAHSTLHRDFQDSSFDLDFSRIVKEEEPKKKKKKKHHSGSDLEFSLDEINGDIANSLKQSEESAEEHLHKKKKKKKMTQEPQEELANGESSIKKKIKSEPVEETSAKKKKIKREIREPEEEMTTTLKKKKKIKLEKEDDSKMLIKDILNSVRNQLEGSTKKKHKSSFSSD